MLQTDNCYYLLRCVWALLSLPTKCNHHPNLSIVNRASSTLQTKSDFLHWHDRSLALALLKYLTFSLSLALGVGSSILCCHIITYPEQWPHVEFIC